MAKPKRVLQVGMSPYYGGTESFIMNQFRNIDREKVMFDFLNVFDSPIACEEEIKSLGGTIYKLNMARHQGIFKYHKRLNAFFKENAEKFDVVHCNFQSLVNIDILKYAKKYNVPVRIAHAHNAGYGTEPNFLAKWIIRRNKKTFAKYANRFFACSTLAGEWMFNKKDVTVIKNAIEAKKFLYNEEKRTAKRLELDLKDEFVITFVGRLDPQKNPVFLIDIFNEIHKRVENAHLLVVGDGYMKPDVEARVKEYGIGNNVSLLGTRKDIIEILQATDAFLLPSRFEGLGIVLIEAQASGLPCFTTEKVVPSDVDVSGLVTFVPAEEPAQVWANKIIEKMNYERKNQLSEIIKAGYDSATNIKFLQEEYMKGF